MSNQSLVSVLQVIPTDDFKVYVYFSDGKIKLYNAQPLIGKGVFNSISEISTFKKTCTVMNQTLAWDVTGNRDPSKCIDIDPEKIYATSVDVSDPLCQVG
jgi:hypothetical protein